MFFLGEKNNKVEPLNNMFFVLSKEIKQEKIKEDNNRITREKLD